jgi:hypothetical protein
MARRAAFGGRWAGGANAVAGGVTLPSPQALGQVSVAPEPGAAWLLLCSLAKLVVRRRLARIQGVSDQGH